MTCKSIQLNQHVETLINNHFANLDVNYTVKRNHPQFYLQGIFGKDDGLELLICITPFEDKSQLKPRRITHSPYRLAIRLVQKVEVLDPDAGLDELQEAVHQLRLALMPPDDETNPFAGYCSFGNQPFEAFPVKYPQPEVNLNVVSALMVLEIPFTEN